jgi:hypothetical protein
VNLISLGGEYFPGYDVFSGPGTGCERIKPNYARKVS